MVVSCLFYWAEASIVMQHGAQAPKWIWAPDVREPSGLKLSSRLRSKGRHVLDCPL